MVKDQFFLNNSKNIDIWILHKVQYLLRIEFCMCVPNLFKIDWEMPAKNPRWLPRNFVFLTFQHQTALISRASSRSPCYNKVPFKKLKKTYCTERKVDKHKSGVQARTWLRWNCQLDSTYRHASHLTLTHSRMPGLDPKWARLTPNRTNLWLFKDQLKFLDFSISAQSD